MSAVAAQKAYWIGKVFQHVGAHEAVKDTFGEIELELLHIADKHAIETVRRFFGGGMV